MRHIVAVAYVSEMDFRQIAEMFLQRKKVGQRLARMLEFTERVNHRNARVGSHLFNDYVAEGAQHDDVDPAFKIVRDVVEGFAGIETAGSLIHKECAAAKAIHSSFKRETSAQRGLLKEHHHLFARENSAEIRGAMLEHGGEIEEGKNFGRGRGREWRRDLAAQPDQQAGSAGFLSSLLANSSVP